MINLNFELSIPYIDRWATIYVIGGMLAKYKAWEFQIVKSTTLVQLAINYRMSGDHAGLQIDVGLLGYSINCSIYETRHWDYEKRCWEI